MKSSHATLVMLAALALVGVNSASAKNNSSHQANQSNRTSRSSFFNGSTAGGSQFKLNNAPSANLGSIASGQFQSGGSSGANRRIVSNLGQQANNLKVKNAPPVNNLGNVNQALNNLGLSSGNFKNKNGGQQITVGQNLARLSGNKLHKQDFHFGKHHIDCHNGWWYDGCWHDGCWHDGCHHYGYYHDGCYHTCNLYVVDTVCLPRCYDPYHCNYFVCPGDTWYMISMKEYGTTANAVYIARFNGMSLSSPLVVGQQLVLPSISTTGVLSASLAPAMEASQVAVASAATTAAAGPPATAPTANMSVAPEQANEPSRPKMSVGSTLLIDGATFGEKPGKAQLRMGGAMLKIEIVEWTANAVKIRLPQLELAGTSNAEIEIVRADGAVVSKAAVELTASTAVAQVP